MNWQDSIEPDDDIGGYDEYLDDESDEQDVIECSACGEEYMKKRRNARFVVKYITRDTGMLADRSGWYRVVWFLLLFS